jgi:hypothetical protein
VKKRTVESGKRKAERKSQKYHKDINVKKGMIRERRGE